MFNGLVDTPNVIVFMYIQVCNIEISGLWSTHITAIIELVNTPPVVVVIVVAVVLILVAI